MNSPWDELGIAPTSDQKIVRRAYAARLKAIDADRDAACFMRLRKAYESALESAQIGQFADGDETLPDDEPSQMETVCEQPVDPATVAHARPMPEPSGSSLAHASPAIDAGAPGDDGIPYGALEGFDTEFQNLLAASDSRKAWHLLNRALAKGIVPLGREPGHVRSLLACALADSALSADDLDACVRAFITTTNTEIASAQILENIKARANALRWWTGIEDATKRGAGWGSCRRLFLRSMRVARAIRTGRARGLMPGDIDEFSRQIVRLREHSLWLPGRADLDRLDRDLQRIQRNDRSRTAAMIALIVSPFVIVRLPLDNDTGGLLAITAFCAGGFGLALLTNWGSTKSLAGRLFPPIRWVLGLVCLAILVVMIWLSAATLAGTHH